MRRFIFAMAIAASAGPALAADVTVSITAGQPGYYGSIDVGNYPRPQLMYAQPVVIEPVPVGVVRQSTYLHVPPGHAKNWRKHCGKYNACGQSVYFVSDSWYNNVYVKGHAKGHGEGQGHGKGHGKDKGQKND